MERIRPDGEAREQQPATWREIGVAAVAAALADLLGDGPGEAEPVRVAA